MIRAGDIVAPFFNMGRHATVLEINEVKTNMWLVGVAAGKARVAKIKFIDNKELAEYSIADLMKIDE